MKYGSVRHSGCRAPPPYLTPLKKAIVEWHLKKTDLDPDFLKKSGSWAVVTA
jgi:hypothetical protein